MTTPVIARSQDMNGTTRLWALSGPHAGEFVERTGIDVREMLATGGWSRTAPEDGPPVTTLPTVEAPAAMALNVTHSHNAAPGVPFALPKGRAARKG